MRVRALDLIRQYKSIKDEIDSAVNRVISSGRYILGEEVENFEREFAHYNGSEYAAGVGSGTDALLVALMALGIGEGDEVITPAYSFTASADVILRVGAKPVFCDVCDDFNIDPNYIEMAVSDRTKAIIVVHLFGLPCDMDKVMNIAQEHNLFVIEDCAQAVGAEYKGKKVGTIGDIGCFSFFPTKNLGCYGDGGMIITDIEKLYEKMRLIRVHGQREKYIPEMLGIKSRLDTIQAGILRAKLKHIDGWNRRRREIADIYSNSLRDIVEVPVEYEDRVAVYHQFTIKSKSRDTLIKHLKERGVDTAIYYPVALNRTPLFQGAKTIPLNCSRADDLTKLSLSIPIYPELTDEEVIYVIDILKEFWD
ncbi:MAG: transcriptional regulator [Candidatus Coatesbacteria bacterium]|nr:MAG: transcriptional regulator [Candidatus Coatesbacteria bacterium]